MTKRTINELPIQPISVDSDVIENPSSLHHSTIILGGLIGFGLTLPHGYNVAILNAFEPAVNKYFLRYEKVNVSIQSQTWLNAVLWSSTTSVYALGGVMGSVRFIYIADKIGRKWACYICFFIALCASILYGVMWFSPKLVYLLLGRFVCGVAFGAGTGLSFLYLAEITPERDRDLFILLNHGTMYLGMLLAQILAVFSSHETYFFTVLCCQSVPCALCSVGLFYYADSPIFQLLRETEELDSYPSRSESPKENTDEIQKPLFKKKFVATWSLRQTSFYQIWVSAPLRYPVFIVCVLYGAQPNSVSFLLFYGGNLTYYIFGSTPWPNVAVISCFILATGVGIYLQGQMCHRKLLCYSSFGTLVSNCFLFAFLNMFRWNSSESLKGHSFVPLVLVTLSCVSLISTYSCGLGCLPYIVSRRMLPYQIRRVGMTVVCMTEWFQNFVVTMAFPLVHFKIKLAALFPFAFTNWMIFLVIWRTFPETKFQKARELALIFHRNHPKLDLKNTRRRERNIWEAQSFNDSLNEV